MINIAFRVVLTVNATLLLVIIFLVPKGYTLGHFLGDGAWLGCNAPERNVLFVFCGEQKLRFDKENQKFEISNDDELKLLLYGIEQRFYTTPFGYEKRLANSVTAMG